MSVDTEARRILEVGVRRRLYSKNINGSDSYATKPVKMLSSKSIEQQEHWATASCLVTQDG